MAILKLKNGIETLIDDEDLLRVSKHVWNAHFAPTTKKYYVARALKRSERRDKTKPLSPQRYLSRFIMNVTDPKLVVDYINQNSLDNRKANLRVCSYRQCKQHYSTTEGKSSKYPGVSWSAANQKWIASIWCGKIHKNLGYFLNERDAAKAYETAVRKLTGDELFCKMGGNLHVK